MVTQLGFTIFSRNNSERYIVFEKKYNNWKPLVLEGGKLDAAAENRLQGRIDTICNMFGDPSEHQTIIRSRLNNIARTLPEAERAFVETWMAANLKGT